MNVEINLLQEGELSEAEKLLRLSFGTLFRTFRADGLW